MNFKSFGVNLIITYGSNIFLGVLGLAFVPFALQKLGLNGFGVFALYTTILSAIALIDLGIGRNLSRNIAVSETIGDGQSVVSRVIALYLIIITIVVFLSPLIALVIPNLIYNSPEYSKIFSIIVYIAVIEYILSIPSNLYVSIAVAQEKFGLLAKYNNIVGVIRYLIMFLTLVVFNDPIYLAMATCSRKILDIFIANKILGKIERYKWQPDFSYLPLKTFAVESIKYSIPQLLQTMVILSSSLSVGKSFGLAGLGIYRSAFDIANRIWFFSNGLGLVIFPRLVKMNNSVEGRLLLKRVLPRQMALSWILYLFISIIVILYGDQFLPVVGISNPEIIGMLKLLVLGISLNAHANLAYEVLQSRTEFGKLNIISSLALVLLLMMYFIFKDHIGVTSIGWAWVISQCIYAFTIDEAAEKGSIELYFIKIICFSLNILCLLGIFDLSLTVVTLYVAISLLSSFLIVKRLRGEII